jgi:hypothetical protein
MRLQIQNNVIVTGNGSKKKCARTIAGGSRASFSKAQNDASRSGTIFPRRAKHLFETIIAICARAPA